MKDNMHAINKINYRSWKQLLALTVVGSLVLWSVILPLTLYADDIMPGPINVRNVLSDSAPGVVADHAFTFQIAAGSDGVEDSEQIVITYSPAGTPPLNFGDIDEVDSGDVTVDVVGGGAISFDSSDATSLTFNVTTSLSPGAEVSILIEGVIINPDHDLGSDDPLDAATHIINVDVGESSTDTRVAIIDNIAMTAAVETIFEFSVAGLDASEDINGNDTTGASTPISFDFGIISPDDFYFLGHELAVETNASNGFVVTIQESQELTSSTGERIHRFTDTVSGGVGTAIPATWANPAGTLNQFETYGHYGITTNDATLGTSTVSTDLGFINAGTGDDAVEGGWVGNFHQEPRPIFAHTDAADGETQNYGVARVGVGIQITSLQAAAEDYANTLTYVATPSF